MHQAKKVTVFLLCEYDQVRSVNAGKNMAANDITGHLQNHHHPRTQERKTRHYVIFR